MSTDKARLVILISGSGSNLQAFIDQCHSGELNAEIACVFSNKTGVFGLERAQQAGIKTEVVDHKLYDSREAFDTTLSKKIESYQPDLIILAGFMRILTPEFVQCFEGRLFNIHPSLLPKYPGLNTHQRAIDAGDEFSGATVHFVTAELDGGPAILQAQVSIDSDDTAATLANKILTKEHIIYPLAAKWLTEGRLTLHDDGTYLDDKKLPTGGFNYTE